MPDATHNEVYPQYGDIDPWEALASVDFSNAETPIETLARWLTKGLSGWELYMMHRATDTLDAALGALQGRGEEVGDGT